MGLKRAHVDVAAAVVAAAVVMMLCFVACGHTWRSAALLCVGQYYPMLLIIAGFVLAILTPRGGRDEVRDLLRVLFPPRDERWTKYILNAHWQPFPPRDEPFTWTNYLLVIVCRFSNGLSDLLWEIGVPYKTKMAVMNFFVHFLTNYIIYRALLALLDSLHLLVRFSWWVPFEVEFAVKQ